MHSSVLVNAYESDLIQSGNRHLPHRKEREEGVQSPACALIQSTPRPSARTVRRALQRSTQAGECTPSSHIFRWGKYRFSA